MNSQKRLAAFWREKLILTILLNLAFWPPYSFLARNAFLPLCTIPTTFMDRLIPFHPHWTPIYLSEYLLTFFVPWLIDQRDDLRRYALGMLFMSGACFFIFLAAPSASPRPDIISDVAIYRFILFMDGPLNAFPSLHAAFLAYTVPIIRPWVRPASFLAIVLWSGAILYATIATRQHFALDLLAGTVVGYLSHFIAWRGRPASFPTCASTCLSSASQFQGGVR